jgi:hypothetical protein
MLRFYTLCRDVLLYPQTSLALLPIHTSLGMRPVTKYGRIMSSTTLFRNLPVTTNLVNDTNQLPSQLEDYSHYSAAQSRDVYHGLPPIDVPRKENQSDYAPEDIRNSEVTSDSLVP